MRMKNSVLSKLILIYIYLPVIIFMIGFVRPFLAILVIAGTLYCLLSCIKDEQKENSEYIMIKWYTVLFLLLIFTVCIVAGFGGMFREAGDWSKHNAVLHDLCEQSWPVYYQKEEQSMLTYYIGQYLIPALWGKVTNSFFQAQIALALYSLFGLSLIYLKCVYLLKAKSFKKQGILFFAFCFFSGALLLAQTVTQAIYPDTYWFYDVKHWINVSSVQLQYRSNFVMLRWISPQCIVPWMMTTILIEKRKKIRYYAVYFLPSILFSSFSFLFFFFAAIIMSLYELAVTKKVREWSRQFFSKENILVILLIGGILFSYFCGYIFTDRPDYLKLSLQDYGEGKWGVYLIFCFFMYGIHMLCIFPMQKKNPLYYLSIVSLSVIPFFKMGLFNDFVMCVSIPPLFICMILILQGLFCSNDILVQGKEKMMGIRIGILIALLVIGAWYPVCELGQNIIQKKPGRMNCDEYQTLAYFADRDDEEVADDLKYNYFTYDLDQSFFYKYIARRKIMPEEVN